MPIPDFQSIMLPLMQLLSDGNEHTAAETIQALANGFRPSPDERGEMLSSGRQARFTNRIHWARTARHSSCSLGGGENRAHGRGFVIAISMPPRAWRGDLR